ncbi:heavy metal transporter, partial [Streptomyces inhibens]
AGGRSAGGGRGLTVPVRQAEAEGADPRRGWELATWAIAHSAELRIEQISYAGRMWTAADSGKGWQRKAAGSAAAARDVRIITAQ